jgi:hypothetical protein
LWNDHSSLGQSSPIKHTAEDDLTSVEGIELAPKALTLMGVQKNVIIVDILLLCFLLGWWKGMMLGGTT